MTKECPTCKGRGEIDVTPQCFCCGMPTEDNLSTVCDRCDVSYKFATGSWCDTHRRFFSVPPEEPS